MRMDKERSDERRLGGGLSSAMINNVPSARSSPRPSSQFRQDDVELTKVDLEKIENVTLKMGAGASGNSAVDIVYPAGKNMEEVVRKVKSALGEQGIPMGRLRRRPEPRKDRWVLVEERATAAYCPPLYLTTLSTLALPVAAR